MDAQELFDGFDPAKYKEEANDRWGATETFKEAARRTAKYGKADWMRIKREHDATLERMAAKMADGATPQSADTVHLAEELRLHIDRYFYPCSRDMHVALADMYEADERFAHNIDKHGAGLTAFVSAAIRANAAR